MEVENIEIIKNNCREYAKSNKSIEVLKVADGKRHYTEIAKLVGVHKTKASGLLKKAEKLGLAKKLKLGVYKKIPGVLGYMPSKRKTKGGSSKTVQDLIQKIEKNRKAISKPLLSSDLTISNKIEVSLGKMTNAYQALYAVENTLRELIRKVFNQKVDWWKNYVPNRIQTQVEDVIKKSPYHAAKRNDELEYTHLGQLKEIIIYRKNWNYFLLYLKEKDKNSFAATINKAIPSRNAIGHCIPLKATDLRVVDVRFDDILKMIK